MARIGRLFRLSAADWQLLLQTAGLLWVIRMGLWLLPFRTLRNIVEGRMPHVHAPPVEAPVTTYRRIRRVTWAVSRLSRYVPKATCLTQALTTQYLLYRAGYPSRIQIGVGRGDNDQFQAHAWVEYDGWIVIGGKGADLFTPIASLQKGPP